MAVARIAQFSQYAIISFLSMLVASCLAKNGHQNAGMVGGRGVGLVAAPDEKIFNIKDFYPSADEIVPPEENDFPGENPDAMATIRAWRAACDSIGKARLLIPKGEFTIGDVVFGGPCKCTSPIVIEAQGTVKAVAGGETSPDAWFQFENIDGLIVTGHGTFDGQGPSVWQNAACTPGSDCGRMPPSFKFNEVSNAIVRGITSINSKGFHMHMYNCTNFRVMNITLLAPADSPNTDGIHVSKSKFVKISRSRFSTGDDCVSIGGGSVNVSVNRVTCGPGHGISIGSLGKREEEGDVNGVIIKNSTLTETDNGLRIKTYLGGFPGLASNIIFRGITMDRVKNPVIIDQEYCRCNNFEPSKTRLSKVHYYDISGTSISPIAVTFKCSPLFPCEDIRLKNVDLKFMGPQPTISICVHAKVAFWGGIQNPLPCPL